MDIEMKIWNFSGTGTKVHAFSNGVALCRKNIKDSEISRPNHKDYCEAKAEVRKAPGTALCTACDTKFNAAVERLENSMKPSTGEGDYLPPAKTENRLSDVKVGDIRYDTARGWKYRVDSIKRSVTYGGSITVSGRCVEDIQDGNDTSYGAYCYELAYNTEAPAEEKESNVTEPESTTVEGTFHTYLKITPEVVQALRYLRNTPHHGSADMVNVLDNAGIFGPIDEATGYDVDPAPERVSKCTCQPQQIPTGAVVHSNWCPGDPAEWGDMAYTTATAVENERLTAEHNARLALRRRPDVQVGSDEWHRLMGAALAETPLYALRKDSEPKSQPCPADNCTLEFKVNADGTLHRHLNDSLEPCTGKAPLPKRTPSVRSGGHTHNEEN